MSPRREGICILCGQRLPAHRSGRRRLYCSASCRQRTYRIREHARLWRGSDPADGGNDVAALLDAALRALRP